MKLSFGVIAVSLAMSVAAPAAADVITFNSASATSFSTDYNQTYNGFLFSFGFPTSGWGVGGGAPAGVTSNSVASPRLFLSGGYPGSVTMTKVGGGAFSLTSFDASALLTNKPSTLIVSGLGGSMPANSTYTVNNAYATYNLSGFDNVTSVTFSEPYYTIYGQTGFNLDNITVGAAVTPGVPEPATWAMLTLGFGAMGLAMRRKKVVTRIRFA